MKIYTNVDLRYNEIQNARIQRVAPSNPVEGTIYYDEANNRIKYYTGNEWISIGGDGGGGSSGDPNVIEQINVNGTNLRINASKVAKLRFSTTGNGDLVIKDDNANTNLGTLNIGSSGVTYREIIAVGTLPLGYSTYIISHNLGTNYLLVQVLDNDGNTIVCNVRRYTSNGENLIQINFSSATTEIRKVIIIGNPDYSIINIISQS